MKVWTLVTRDTVAHARVLAAALAEHHAGVVLHALVVGPALPGAEPFTAVRLGAVAPELRVAVARFPWAASSLLVRVAVLRHALAEAADGEVVLLVDGEVEVHAPLDPLADAVAGRAEVALVPRVAGTTLPADGRHPDDEDLVECGLFDPLLVAARRGPDVLAFLDWWTEHLEATLGRMGPGELARLRLGPWRRLSRWLDVAPARFPGLTVLDDPGVGLSAWNLPERPLGRDADGRRTAGGRRLRAVTFDGFDPRAPHWLRPGADRVRVPGDRPLSELTAARARALLDAGWTPPADAIAPGTRLPNGLVLDERALTLAFEAELRDEELGDLRTPAGAAALLAHLAAPAEHGAAVGLNRYTERVWSEREDVRRAFPDLDDPGDAERFAEWTWEWGRAEMGIPPVLLPPAPAGVGAAVRAAAAADGAEPAPLPPVHVAGFLRGALGLGAAARLYVEAVAAAGLQVSTTTVGVPGRDDVADKYASVDFEDRVSGGGGSGDEPGVDVVCVNADELPAFAAQLGDRYGAARRTIGIWAWETDHIPKRWGPIYGLVDEIWTYTRYVAENIARVAPVPVVPIPIPVPVPDVSALDVDALDLGLPPAEFTFLFVFDFLSTPARKNPAGLIEAFTRAFPPGSGVRLIVKTLHGDLRPAALDRLRWLAGDREGRDIHLIDRSLSVTERDALMASCDCYVSLHRAEGFGLTLAEAMALGKPVIGTAYSGTLDFMNQMNSYLVDFTMTRVGPEGEHYPADGLWADPSLDHAAELMHHVVHHPTDATAKAMRAQSDVASKLSATAVGKLIAVRLDALRDLRLLITPPRRQAREHQAPRREQSPDPLV